MRVVLDTNVLVAALRSKQGASAEVLRAAHDGRLTVLANVALFAEYEAVLTRPEHLAAGGVTHRAVTEALDASPPGSSPRNRIFPGVRSSAIQMTRWC